MIVLYHYEPSSTSSQKVRLCLSYKNLVYTSKNINLECAEHLENEYLKVNRHGLLPIIVHNGNKIRESNFINEYLDKVYPEKSLVPKNAVDFNFMQYLCKQQEYLNENCLRYYSYISSNRIELIDNKWLKEHPQLDRRKFLRLVKYGLTKQDLHEIDNYLINELNFINSILEKTLALW
ncbi:glutathione S-transferase family protein [Piscirickettsia litoralis]|uniref:GST N-terminal domain-containing protein n=1 Tax=Piscirickettsia litoralis TaxID=1891921 RepID=A0ABX3A012_9GAMM|nr:glutathione S-transferase family protein [Piscirickettsia litoralis]ODN41823.1 hypothetical protein BGC07_01065 [Piscirickettsia litoralis]